MKSPRSYKTLYFLLSAIFFAFIIASLADAGVYDTQSKSAGKNPPSKVLTVTSSPATLEVSLVDAEQKAQKKTATVKATVTGLRIVDPAASNEYPVPGEGHLHYQVDNGFVIATTATKLSFHGLSSGQHKISVTLAGNDHQPLGAPEILTVNIP
jgi:hypothetical protein